MKNFFLRALLRGGTEGGEGFDLKKKILTAFVRSPATSRTRGPSWCEPSARQALHVVFHSVGFPPQALALTHELAHPSSYDSYLVEALKPLRPLYSFGRSASAYPAVKTNMSVMNWWRDLRGLHRGSG